MDIEKTDPTVNGTTDTKLGIGAATKGADIVFTRELEGVFKENNDKARAHLKNQQFEEAIALFEANLKAA